MKTEKTDKTQALDLGNQASLMHFLKQPTLKIAEFLTGVLASDKKDWKLSAGHLIQATIKSSLLTQLGNEIKKYQSEGKIKENFLESDINRASFKELLEFIDSETPDEMRFKAMKSVFFSALVENGDESLAYELMKTCRKLSSMEIQILVANYNIAIGKSEPVPHGIEWGSNRRIDYWASNIAEQIGHHVPEIILQYEEHLMMSQLISRKHYPQVNYTYFATEFEPTKYFRMTDLGYKLCEFITKYE